MREGCKSSGTSEARGSGVGERWRREFLTGVGRRGDGGECDRWGPLGGDRGRRRRRRAAQTRSRDNFWQLHQGRTCRDGLSARAAACGTEWASTGEAGPGGPNSKKKILFE
jgi:hypothetical protein